MPQQVPPRSPYHGCGLFCGRKITLLRLAVVWGRRWRWSSSVRLRKWLHQGPSMKSPHARTVIPPIEHAPTPGPEPEISLMRKIALSAAKRLIRSGLTPLCNRAGLEARSTGPCMLHGDVMNICWWLHRITSIAVPMMSLAFTKHVLFNDACLSPIACIFWWFLCVVHINSRAHDKNVTRDSHEVDASAPAIRRIFRIAVRMEDALLCLIGSS